MEQVRFNKFADLAIDRRTEYGAAEWAHDSSEGDRQHAFRAGSARALRGFRMARVFSQQKAIGYTLILPCAHCEDRLYGLG